MDEGVDVHDRVRVVTHKVMKDVALTMQRAYEETMSLKQQYGPDAVITLELTVHLPRRKALHAKSDPTE